MDEFSTVRINLSDLGRPGDVGRAAALVVIRGPDLGRRFTLAAATQTIGRLGDVEISILDQSLSRRHCALRYVPDEDEGVYVVRDLGSTNGTFINGRRIQEQALANGDKITVGDVVLKFVLLDTVEEDFHHEVADLIRRDRLTGLLNVSAFYDELDKALYQARYADTPVAVLMLDIDGLKQVNDTYGHLLGSEVIRLVARELRKACDAVRGVAAIYGGDEFIAYIPGSDERGALSVGETVRSRIADMEFRAPDGRGARVKLSGGVAEFPRDGTVRELVVRRADVALYAAKGAGKNRIMAFRPTLERET